MTGTRKSKCKQVFGRFLCHHSISNMVKLVWDGNAIVALFSKVVAASSQLRFHWKYSYWGLKVWCRCITDLRNKTVVNWTSSYCLCDIVVTKASSHEVLKFPPYRGVCIIEALFDMYLWDQQNCPWSRDVSIRRWGLTVGLIIVNILRIHQLFLYKDLSLWCFVFYFSFYVNCRR